MIEKKGAWKIKDSIIKFKNNWIELIEDQVIRPDNKEGKYAFLKLKPGVSVLPLDDEGFVYLGEEFKYAINKISLECISGAIEDGETPLDCAKRELKEELGIKAEEWINLGFVEIISNLVNCPQHLFLVKKLSFGEQELETVESIKKVKIKFEDAVKKVLNNDINDCQSALLILKVKEFIDKNK